MADLDNCGYWRYLGEKDVPKVSGSMTPVDPSQLWPGIRPVTEYTESHSTPRILTRAEKGQALTHLEMDFNLASLFHKLNTSSAGSTFSGSEYSETEDVYFEGRKPTRQEEMEGMFVTFSYAPIVNGTQSIIQNPFQTVKVQHTTDEIRYKLSNERIPGFLDIEEDFHVSGSVLIHNDLTVSGSTEVTGNLAVAKDTETNTLHVVSSSVLDGDLRTKGTSSFEGDVYIVGNLYVNGVAFGNLSQVPYKSQGEYAEPYDRREMTSSADNPTAMSGLENSEKTYYTKAEVDELIAALRQELLNG